MDDRFSKYISANLTYKITNNNKMCQCSKMLKENYRKSKIEIINAMEQKNKIIKEKEKEINDLYYKNKNLENTNYSLISKNNNLNLNIFQLQGVDKENNKLNLENKSKNEKIKKLENDITLLNEKIKELNSKIKELQDICNNCNKDIKRLNNDNKRLIQEKEVLEIAINGDASKINELKKLGITGQYLNPNENTFRIDKETNQFVFEEKKK